MVQKSLVIVESPAKAGTIKKYLGAAFEVKATVGHIKDLPKKKLGVDLERDFLPEYETIPGKNKVLSEIKAAAKLASVIYLAPDPDREGEAIAWHVAEEFAPSERKKVKRVLFNEITKTAIQKALLHPLEINVAKFESQQARRILDRLVGYKLSPLLWQKVRRGISAGRVQSVAVRLVAEREKEIGVFKSEEYWNIQAVLEKDQKIFAARLVKENGKKIEKMSVQNKEHADRLIQELKSAVPFKVSSIQKKERRRHPDAPFITSRLQQEAARRLRFSAKKTMMLAQRLYEGVDIGDDGQTGLITYMRTDSVRVSDEAMGEVRQHIAREYGQNFVPPSPNTYKTRNQANAQDAHEAIRPTSLAFTPERVKKYLEPDMFRLYQLIWNRFVASQMTSAIYDQTTVEFASGAHELRSTGSILRFAGFTQVYSDEPDEDNVTANTPKSEVDAARLSALADEENIQLPDLSEGEKLHPKDILGSQHFTQPPPRFTEASLVRELEERGIGRPSTYATIMSTIVDREYVEKKENRFFPTELGMVVTELLLKNFPQELDYQFTSQMEDLLDNIEEGKQKWVDVMRKFYTGFEKSLEKAKKNMQDMKTQEIPTEVPCPKCAKLMVIKWGKNGQFLACSGYPDCKSTSPFEKDANGKVTPVKQEVQLSDEKCPTCGGAMVVKTGKFGRFLACSQYPECKTTKAMSIGVKCPQCQHDLTEKRSGKGKVFFGCSGYPKCTFATWDRPVATPCPSCQAPFVTQKITKKDGVMYVCVQKECGMRQSEEEWRSAQPLSKEAPSST